MEVLKDNNWEISEETLGLVCIDLAIKYNVVPLSCVNDVLTLLVDEDFDGERKEVLEFILCKSILTVSVDKNLLDTLIERYYSKIKKEGEHSCLRGSKVLNVNVEEDISSEKEVLGIINEGIQKGASDIHWELQSYGLELVIRYRVDGELVSGEVISDRRLANKIISYIKLLSHMSIDQKRLPQDGRLAWSYIGKKYDLRVSSLSTIHGENLVMRILDRENLNLNINALGLLEGDLWELTALLKKQDGLLLVTGPTGSGKTTTLYAALNFRSQFDDKIITVEDPVEYEFSNFSQIPVSISTGITFASALRAMLRQSPDTIMIGEIRDKETAQIAVNAALTGHLVLSTLHTNDTVSAILRLLDLGVEPYQISAALRGVVAQRLVKRLCAFCKQSYIPSEEELRLLDLGLEESKGHMFFHSKGCEGCQHTGFNGRLGLFEILCLEKTFSGLIYGRVSHQDLKNHIQLLGISTLKRCGIEKIFMGLTTIEEVAASLIMV